MISHDPYNLTQLLFLKKKDKKSDIDNYNFYDRQTDRHGDSMTNQAWRAKSVEKKKSFSFPG